jgi:hypothetical protein
MEPGDSPLDMVTNKPPWSSVPLTEPAYAEVGGWLVSRGDPAATNRRGGTTVVDWLGVEPICVPRRESSKQGATGQGSDEHVMTGQCEKCTTSSNGL